LDVLSDLKRIHSHICSVAYPVLEAAGEHVPKWLQGETDASVAGDDAKGIAAIPPRPL